jgi:sulfonate transport system permease protein
MMARARSGSLLRTCARVGVALVLAAAWQLVAVVKSDERLFPTIGTILGKSLPGLALFAGGPPSYYGAATVVAGHSAATIVRILGGVGAGVILGLSAALGIHLFRRGERANAVVLHAVGAVPLMALIPLFVYWFGSRIVGIYCYIAFGAFVVIATASYQAIADVPPNYYHQARLLGAGPLRRLLTVHLFAIQPRLWLAIRDVLGLAWAFSLGAEYISAQSGMGYLVYQSYLYSDMGKLIVLAALYVAYSYVTYLFANVVIDRLVVWDLPQAGKE